MNTRIYVGNIDLGGSGEALAELFGRYGTVITARIVRDAARSPNNGFGYVVMAEEGDARAAVAALSGYVHGGRALSVQAGPTKPEHERDTAAHAASAPARGELVVRSQFHAACAGLAWNPDQGQRNAAAETAKREALEAWESEGGATAATPP